jgi:hypothetical protein
MSAKTKHAQPGTEKREERREKEEEQKRKVWSRQRISNVQGLGNQREQMGVVCVWQVMEA